MSLKVIASMSIAVCMGFVYNQSAEGIGTVMRITVASGVILILPQVSVREPLPDCSILVASKQRVRRFA